MDFIFINYKMSLISHFFTLSYNYRRLGIGCRHLSAMSVLTIACVQLIFSLSRKKYLSCE